MKNFITSVPGRVVNAILAVTVFLGFGLYWGQHHEPQKAKPVHIQSGPLPLFYIDGRKPFHGEQPLVTVENHGIGLLQFAIRGSNFAGEINLAPGQVASIGLPHEGTYDVEAATGETAFKGGKDLNIAPYVVSFPE